MIRRILLAFGVVLLAAAGLWYAWSFETSGPAQAARTGGPQAPALPVLAAEAATRAMPVEIATIGNVQPIASVAVKPRIDGEIVKVAVQDGQEVKAGDVLFVLDSRQAQAALDQALATQQRDRAQLAGAQRELDRLTPLGQKNFASKQQLDAAQTSVDAAQATLKADQAAVDGAQVELSYTTIRAPIDGRAGDRRLQARQHGQGRRRGGAGGAQPAAADLRRVLGRRRASCRAAPGDGRRPLDGEARPSPAPRSAAGGDLTFVDNAVDTAPARFGSSDLRQSETTPLAGAVRQRRRSRSRSSPTRSSSPRRRSRGSERHVRLRRASRTARSTAPGDDRRAMEAQTPSSRAASRPGERVVTTRLRLAPGIKVTVEQAGPRRQPGTRDEPGRAVHPPSGHDDARHGAPSSSSASSPTGRCR